MNGACDILQGFKAETIILSFFSVGLLLERPVKALLGPGGVHMDMEEQTLQS